MSMNILQRVSVIFTLTSICHSFYFGDNGFEFGKHKPTGEYLVSYMTGPFGPWKSIGNLEYVWNYYQNYATNDHPFNKSRLIEYASPQKNHNTTARDANGHLLWDLDHDLEIDESSDYGSAFCEHYGSRWVGDQDNTAQAFTNFWYDDNDLANFMTQAYDISSPSGLSDYQDFRRWSIVGGISKYWTLYNTDTTYYDQLSLNGLYYLSQGDSSSAMRVWNKIMNLSAPAYDGGNQQYTYPAFGAPDLYYLGLVKIFTDLLAIQTQDTSGILTQHSMSLRSAIMDAINTNQQQGTHLINTETMSSWALALGAGAYESYDFGTGSLQYPSDHNYYMRPYHALSAIIANDASASKKGYLSYGPYSNYPVGDYVAEFFLRAHDPQDGTNMVTIEVHDAASDEIFGQQDLSTGFVNDKWVAFSTNFTVTDPTHGYEFRTFWQGVCNIDMGFIRVRSLRMPTTPSLTSSEITSASNAQITSSDLTTGYRSITTASNAEISLTTDQLDTITTQSLTTQEVVEISMTTQAVTTQEAASVTSGVLPPVTTGLNSENDASASDCTRISPAFFLAVVLLCLLRL